MTWEEALKLLDTVMEMKNYAFATRTGYQEQLRTFLRFVRARGIQNPTEVTRDFLSAYASVLCTETYRGKPLAASTRMHRLLSVKLLFRTLQEAGYVIIDPAARVPLPRLPKVLPRNILSQREMERLICAPNRCPKIGLRNRAILELLYSTGIRNQELRMLRLSDVDFEREELRVLGKGRKTRVLPLGTVAAHWLTRYLSESRPKLQKKPSDYVFLSFSTGEPLTRDGLIEIVLAAARAAKLPPTKAISPHVIRHTCATHLLRAKAPLRAIQELLGHAQLSSTQIYTHVEISDLKRVHAKCHPREKEPWARPKP